jgi:hypothetical protein
MIYTSSVSLSRRRLFHHRLGPPGSGEGRLRSEE